MPVGISYRAMLAAAGSSAAADAYIVNSFAPPVVADFAGVLNSGTEYYRVGGSDSTFDSMFTYTGASLKTMTDSDGILKWAPHNFLGHSATTSGSSWNVVGAAESSNVVTASAGAGDHYIRNRYPTTLPNVNLTARVRVTPGTHQYVALDCYGSNSDYVTKVFDLSGAGAVGETSTGSATGTLVAAAITSNGDGSYTCSVTYNCEQSNTISGVLVCFANAASGNTFDSDGIPQYTAAGTETFTLHEAAIHRADLGGMVDNPDTDTQFVTTTTTAAVYQARRNHYRYNGTSYVNKGILLESEARTSLSTVFGTSTADYNVSIYNATVAASSETDPSGNTNAVKITANSGAGVHQGNITDGDWTMPATAGAYSFSIFVKAGTSNYAHVRAAASSPGIEVEYVINLTSGAVAQTIDAGDAVYVEQYGGGWWRITLVDTSSGSAATGPGFLVGPHDGSASPSWTAAGTETIHVWGFQPELGATPSSVIPTSGATVTRAAETLTIAGANMSASTTAMSFQIAGELNYIDDNTGDQFRLFSWEFNSNNRLLLQWNTATGATGGPRIFNANGGLSSNMTALTTTYSPGINVSYNLGWRQTTAVHNVAASGSSGSAESSTEGIYDLSGTNCLICTYDNGANRRYMGTIALLRQWAVDIGDTGIESATS